MKTFFQLLLGLFICVNQISAEQLEIDSSPNLERGIEIFNERCMLCHGEKGEGNGKMIKVLKTPPPADLTSSVASDEYLEQIIAEGGESVGRSTHMPPWKDELSNEDIQSVIFYIKTFRKNTVLNEVIY